MNTTETDPETRLAALASQFQDFAGRWRQWAFANQPIVKRCDAHAFDRRVNEQRSLGESWQRQEFVVIYKKCPGCWRDKHQPAKPETKRGGKPHKNK